MLPFAAFGQIGQLGEYFGAGRLDVGGIRDAGWFVDYYPNESVQPLEGGRTRVTLRVTDPSWVRRAAWRLGGSLTVVSPPELVASVREGALAALDGYAAPAAHAG